MAAPSSGAGGGGEGAAWVIPGLAVLAFAAGGALWVAGALATMIAGHDWHWPPFTVAAFVAVIRHGTRTSWPHADPRVLLALAGLLFAAVAAAAALVVMRVAAGRPGAGDPARSLARSSDVAALLAPAAARRAQQLRPTLAATKPADLAAGEVGVLLGQLAGSPRGGRLFASWEDVGVAFMAPRSGKTTSLAIPITLAAPGAVVMTSNKVEGWKETAALRASDTGARVWTFDPQQIAHAPQTWWWNPLAGLDTVAEASRLAGHFVATIEGERGDVWGPAAKELLATLMLAAALGGHTLVDVYAWLADEATPVPRGILAQHGFDLLAATLRSTQDSPPETRGSVYFTARAATACLRDGAITAWVTPPGRRAPRGQPQNQTPVTAAESEAAVLVEFDPRSFPTTRQSLYLLSKDDGGSAGPLVAALTDAVLRAGVAAAERAGGRLDPPMVAVLDEAANICRIGDLPALYSHLGSRGISPWTILQSYSQAVAVWGATGTKALWGAATIKLIGAGMDDADFAEDVSRLVGDHDVATVSHSSGSAGGSSRTRSWRTQRILSAAAVRQLPRGHALLLATGTKPAMVRLLPWYTGPRATQIAAAAAAAQQQVTARAAHQTRDRDQGQGQGRGEGVDGDARPAHGQLLGGVGQQSAAPAAPAASGTSA